MIPAGRRSGKVLLGTSTGMCSGVHLAYGGDASGL